MRFAAVVAGALLLSACGSVGVRRAEPFADGEPFERALIAFVRGDDAEAARALREADPGDLRARDLLEILTGEAASGGADPLPNELDPEGLFRLTLGRDPVIRAAFHKVVESRARLAETSFSFSPEFDLMTRFYPAAIVAGLTLSLLESLVGRDSRMAAAEEAVLEAVARYAEARARRLHEAALGYLDVLEAEESLAALEGAGERLAAAAANADLRVSVEGGPLAEGLEVRACAERVGRLVAASRTRAAQARAALNGLIAREVDRPLALAPRSFRPSIPSGIPDMIAWSRRDRPEVRMAEHRLAGARAGQGTILPDLVRVGVGATYGKSLSSAERSNDFLEGFGVDARAHVPLLLIPLQGARSDIEDAIQRQLELQLEEMRHKAAVDAVTSYQALRGVEAEESAGIARLREAEEALRVERIRAKYGHAASPGRLARAESGWCEAKRDAVARAYDRQRGGLSLYRALGIQPDRLLFAFRVDGPASRDPGRVLAVENPADPEFLLDFVEARGFRAMILTTSDTEEARRLVEQARARSIPVHFEPIPGARVESWEQIRTELLGGKP